MFFRNFGRLSRVLALAFVVSLSSSVFAQVVASQGKGNPNAPAPKWDIFVGYSILDPRGTFYPIQPDGSVLPVSFKLEKSGLLESADYYFTRHTGVLFESGQHDLFTNTGFARTGSSNSGILTLESGLVYRWPGVHLTPFVHGFGGAANIDGPDHEPYTWGPVVGGGGGLDWYFGCHFGVRLFEADYEYLHVNSGVSSGTIAGGNFVWGDDENINAIRLAAGVVVRGSSAWGPTPGCGALPPPALTCVATPNVVFPGDPVTITGTAEGLNPKETVTWTWTGAGASGPSSMTTINTTSLGPGSYTVKGTVAEGPKPVQSADCLATFTVRQWEKPTLECSAAPLAITSDETSTLTLNGRSPQNLPLTYACTSSAGTVAMNGNTATFSPSGAPAGPVSIKCTVSDDKGQTSDTNCAVTIQRPPPPPPVHVSLLCSIDFSRDKSRPTRVDNEAKACLDGIALNLTQQPDATLVVVGEATADEMRADPTIAAERAVNAKEYFTGEKGIDPTRVVVVTGGEGTQAVEDYLAPAGASFTSDIAGTVPVDESVVKPQERKALPMLSHPAHLRAAAKTPAAAAPPSTAAPAIAPRPAHHGKKHAAASGHAGQKKSAGTPATGTNGP